LPSRYGSGFRSTICAKNYEKQDWNYAYLGVVFHFFYLVSFALR